MTTGLDIKILPMVLEILEKYGRTVTVTIKAGTKDWSTGIVNTTTTSHTVKCSPPQPFNQRYVDGDLIQTGDMETIFAAQDLPFGPALNMRIDDKWTGVRVDPIYSGDQVAAWKVQLRG